MDSSRSTQFRLESVRKRGIIAVFFLFFFFMALCVVIGVALGPEPWISNPEAGTWRTVPAPASSIRHSIYTQPFNGEWWFYFRPDGFRRTNNRTELPLLYLDVIVSIYAWDKNENPQLLHSQTRLLQMSCQRTTHQCYTGVGGQLANGFFIEKPNLAVDITFPQTDRNETEILERFSSFSTKFYYSNYQFWVFELAFRSIFLAATLGTLFVYLWSLMKHQSGVPLALEQKFVFGLLILLFLCNNPLFAAQVFVKTSAFAIIDVVFVFTYVSYLLLMILCMTHAILLRDQPRRFCSFYLPKFVLIFVLWATSSAMFSWAKYKRRLDPTDTDYTRKREYTLAYTVSSMTVALYLFWLFYLVCRVGGEWRSLTFYTRRFKFLWGLTLVVITFTAGCLLLALFYQPSAAVFLFIYGLYNAYTFTLAYLYSPATYQSITNTMIGMTRMPAEEYPDELEMDDWA
eukprot:TRINITY_DN14823_c0_g1_i1.p1 TRINITY_DN14823_c0_g1~~TRINITY_DN14823_c0_g1_i1.p1  ORF type:complete len:458 (+),score=90.03 TRINITY_DN14823_c0_g1_i1:90-1463(+)